MKERTTGKKTRVTVPSSMPSLVPYEIYGLKALFSSSSSSDESNYEIKCRLVSSARSFSLTHTLNDERRCCEECTRIGKIDRNVYTASALRQGLFHSSTSPFSCFFFYGATTYVHGAKDVGLLIYPLQIYSVFPDRRHRWKTRVKPFSAVVGRLLFRRLSPVV